MDLQNFEETKTTGIGERPYTKEISKALKYFRLPTFHQMHFGRVGGSYALEVREGINEDTRILGNWDPKMQEKAYSTKLPLRAICGAGGHVEGNGQFYNVRTTCEPPDSLQQKIWPWIETQVQRVEATFDSLDADPSRTAWMFLRFLKKLRRIALQDAAYMMIKHPARAAHPVFQMDVFQMEEFGTFKEKMKEHIATSVSPLDATVDDVLPGIQDQVATQS